MTYGSVTFDVKLIYGRLLESQCFVTMHTRFVWLSIYLFYSVAVLLLLFIVTITAGGVTVHTI